MNKTTAQQLLIAVAEANDAFMRIRRRQEKVTDAELELYQDAFDDFRWFGDQLEKAIEGIHHRVLDAQEIVCKKRSQS